MDETLTLLPSKPKWIFVTSTLAGLALLFLVALPSAADPPSRWFLIGCAALSFVGAVLAACALTGAAYLRLSREGFVARTLTGGEKRYSWIEVADFAPLRMRGTAFVMFRTLPVAREAGTLERASAKVLGFEQNLPDTYGLAPEELAGLMNDWRRRHAGEPSRPATG